MDKKILNLLILEDNPDDAGLIVKELEKEGFIVKWNRIDTKQAFKESLADKPDLILVDYKLPTFDGMSALKLQQKLTPGIPLIIVSGTIGEEVAVECLKAGAIDYVLKDKLTCLGPVVKRALKEAQEHQERERAKQIQIVLYNIAHAVNTTKNLNELFESIKNHLSAIINTTNIYIALYDKESGMISLPYHIDEKDKFDTFLAGKTLTAYVIRTGKPLWGSEETCEKLIQSGEVERGKTGAPAKIWVGVPLKVEKEIIGVIAVQSYTDASLYTEKDLEILEFVSDEIAIAIERKQIQDALRESEEMYKMLTETSPDAVTMTDLEGCITFVSQRTLQLHNYENAEELLGKSALKLIASEEHKMAITNLQKTLKQGYLRNKEYILLRKDGTSFIGELNASLIKDTSGEPKAFIATTSDITARKRTEEALRESEIRYHSIFDSATDSFLIFDLDGNIVEANSAACKMYGYPYKELIKLSGKDIVHSDYYHLFKNFKRDVQTTGEFHAESVDVHKDGTYFDIEVRGTKLDYKGKPHLLAVVRDITQRKKAEETLRKSEERNRLITENTSDIIALTTFEMNPIFTYVSPSVKIMGYKPKDLIGKPCLDFIHPDNKKVLLSLLKEYISGKVKKLITGKGVEITERVEFSIKDKSGNWHHFQSTVNIIGDQILFVSRDITEQKKSEQLKDVLYNITNAVILDIDLNELFQSIRKYLSTIIDTTNFYIALYNKETDTISLPYAIDEMTQYTSFPAVKTLTNYVIKSGKSLLATQKVQNELINSGKVKILGKPSKVWLGVPLKKGKNVIGLIAVHSYKDSNLYTEKDKHILEFVSGQIVLAIERKHAEKEIEKRQKYLESVLHDAPDAIVTADASHRIIEWNPGAEQIFGYTSNEALGENIDDLITKPDVKSEATSITGQVLSGKKVSTLETIRYRKDGTPVNVILAGSPIRVGNEMRGAVAVYTDITKRKKTEENLRESEKKYRSLVENLEEGIATVDEKENLMLINRAGANIFGYSKKELLKMNVKDFTTPEEFKKVLKKTSLRKNGKLGQYEFTIVQKDGSLRNILMTASPIFDSQKNYTGSFGIFHDITERKKWEKELLQKNEELSRFNKMAVNREIKMIELKKEINTLLKELGKKPRYEIVE